MAATLEWPQDFANQNKGPTVLAACITLTAVATVFVSARLYVRSRILSRVSLDDWLILSSIICGYVMLGLTIAAVRAGNGRHFVFLTDDQRSGAILYTLAGFCPGILSFAIPKLAVVALLTRITNPSHRHKMFLWAMTTTCLVILFGCVIIIFAQCSPSRSQWDFSVQGTCWSPWILIYYAIVAGTLSAIVDLYLAVYPALVLYRLQMNLKKKLALSFALGLGSVASAVAVYKSTRLPALASTDFSYDTADITIWTSIEGNAIIIAACIPTLQPLFDLILGRGVFGSTGDHRAGSGYGDRGCSRVKLATIGSKTRGTGRRNRRLGVSDTTLGQDSQESILSSEQQVEDQQRSGIVKTQQLSVAFENVHQNP